MFCVLKLPKINGFGGSIFLPKLAQHQFKVTLMTCYSETNLEKFQEMTRKTEIFLDHTGMTAKHRKCAISQAQRSGNNWKELPQCEIRLQNDLIPVLKKEESSFFSFFKVTNHIYVAQNLLKFKISRFYIENF